MISPMTSKERELTVKNVLDACKDITKLNKRGYNYLYLASGFIAHYDINGFKNYYHRPDSLSRDILMLEPQNRWTNFRPGEENYEYYHQKGEIYAEIVGHLKVGLEQLNLVF
jgi:hypothetical protein